MISVIVTSRVEGNVNHNLNELIRSLKEHSRTPNDIELLVKFDDDDTKAPMVADDILHYNLPFNLKVAFGPRMRGYTDIHHGYNQLLTKLDRESTIVIAMADDFRAERDWDTALKNASKDASEYFIIHGRPHPVIKEEFIKIKDKPQAWKNFNMFYNMFDGEDLYIIDEAPAWSTPLLVAAAMYGTIRPSFDTLEVFPVSFTDAWTLCLEYALCHNEHINITKFMPNVFISRKTCEVDQPGNARWHTDRKNNFDYIKSPAFRNIVEKQAREISSHIRQKVEV